MGSGLRAFARAPESQASVDGRHAHVQNVIVDASRSESAEHLVAHAVDVLAAEATNAAGQADGTDQPALFPRKRYGRIVY